MKPHTPTHYSFCSSQVTQHNGTTTVVGTVAGEVPPHHNTLDQTIRNELHRYAPPNLTARLLVQAAIAADNANGITATTHPTIGTDEYPPNRTQPGTWYSLVVFVLTSLAMGLSVALAWEFYHLLDEGLGLAAAWHNSCFAFEQGLQYMYATVPITQTLVHGATLLYEQATWVFHWVLVAILLWLGLDAYTPMPQLQHYHSQT
jgi:hypothetical protein